MSRNDWSAFAPLAPPLRASAIAPKSVSLPYAGKAKAVHLLSGVGGWNHKAIYMPQPYDGNTVLEVVLGVPSGSYVRTWVGD